MLGKATLVAASKQAGYKWLSFVIHFGGINI
jgi:hypothetical protein